MTQNRPSGEIYDKNDGIRLLYFLELLNDNLAEYVKGHFSSTASGPDLLTATKDFYSSTIIQLAQTGEFVPGQENTQNPAIESRAHRFDMAVKEKLQGLFDDGICLEAVLKTIKVPKYIPEDRDEPNQKMNYTPKDK